MKKTFYFTLTLLVLIGCLTACNFSQSAMDAIADAAEFTPKVEEMMVALAHGNTSDAKALLHPQFAESSDRAIAQMSDYVAGRKVSAMDLKNINNTNTYSTAGNAQQEEAVYQVTLSDGAVIFLSTLYCSNDQGDGFASFQIVLGTVY